ncbi:MAG: secretin N-terminal domain-containing protein [Planctomycetota bacterium]|nr:secretin N-terminal domain-containing protein [Planctomycetota bacterium]
MEQISNAKKPADALQLRFYQLNENLSEITSTLQTIVKEGTVTWLETQQKLAVIADTPTHELVKKTIEQINLDLPLKPKKTLKILAVTSVQKEKFDLVFPDLASELGDAKLVSGAAADEIAIFADAEQHQAVEAILASLATLAETDEKILTKIAIQVDDTDQLISLLKDKLPNQDFLINPDKTSLIAWIRNPEIEKVKEIVRSVEAVLPKRETLTLEIYKIEGSVPEIEKFITPIAVNAKITLDAANQRIVVWGNDEDHQKIKALLAKVDRPPLRKSSLEIYPLENSTPEIALEMISKLNLEVTTTPSTDSKSLLVWGNDEYHQKIKALVAQLATLKNSGKTQVEIYPVDRLSASKTLAAVQAVFPDADVSLDSDTNRIISVANADLQLQIKSLIDKLAPTKPLAPKILMSYELKHADATTVVGMLSDLHPETRFAADERANRVLVTAELAEQPRFKSVIAQLDAKSSDRNEKVLQTYTLKSSKTDFVSELIEPLLPEMKFSIDNPSLKLIALGTVADHQKLANLLKQIGDGKTESKVLKHYALGSAPVEEVQNILLQVVPTATIAVNGFGGQGKMVVWATPEEQTLIEAAINQLNNVPDELSLKNYDLKRQISGDIVTLLQGLSNKARVALSPDGKQLVVLAPAADHPLFASVVKELMKTEQTNLILKSYESTENVIAAAVAAWQSVPEAIIVPQSNPEKLVVWATDQDHAKIQKSISDLESQIEKTPAKKTTTIYPLGQIPKSSAIDILNLEFKELSILTDEQPNRLVIRSDENTHRQITQIIKDLTSVFEITQKTVIQSHAVRKDLKSQATTTIGNLLPNIEFLENGNDSLILAKASLADHASLKNLIKTLESEIAREEPRTVVAYPLVALEKSLVTQILGNRFPETTFVSEDQADRILVWALPAEHEQIPAILQGLEETIAVEKELVVNVYNIEPEKMTAEAVLELIDPSLKENITIQVASATNSLVVRASQPRHLNLKTAISSIVSQITSAPAPITKVYDFPAGNAESVSQLIAPLLTNSTASVSPDEKKLAVTSNEEGHRLIQSVISQLDLEIDGKNASTIVYRLNAAIPSVIEKAIIAISPKAKITSDDKSMSLIVTTGTAEHRVIESILKQINDSSLGKKTEVYTLQLAEPDSLVNAISALVTEATVTADQATNSVVVTALAADFDRIETIVDKLEKVAGEKTKDLIAKVYPFDPDLVDAADMQDVIDPQLGEGMNVRINEVGNGLIVRTTPEKHEQLKTVFEQVIAQLPARKKIATKVYRLQNVSPAAIEKVLEAKYAAADFAVDSNSRTVVATVSLGDHEEISAILEQMETTASGQEWLSQAFPLKIATPSVVAEALRALLPNAKINFDLPSKTVVVTGSPLEIQSAKDLIQQVDGSGEGKTTQVYRMGHTDPKSVVPAVLSLFPTATVTADPYSRALLVTAAEKEHLEISKLVKELNLRKDQRSEVYKLALADPGYLATAFQPLVPNALVSADRNSKTLFVTGSDDDHLQVKQLIEKLNGQGIDQVTEVYKLSKANSTVIRPALSALIPDGNVTADQLSNTVVISASATDQAKIAEVIEKLEKATGTELILKIYKSKFNNPDPLNSTLENMFRDDKEVRIKYEWENQRIMIVTNEGKHKLIASLIDQIDQAKPVIEYRFAKVYHLENIEGQVAQEVIRNLYGWQVPRIDFRVEKGTNALIIVATEKQHKILGPSIQEVDGDLRTLEVFPLVNVDPYTVELAIEQLFAEIPENMAPSATSDFGTQQVFVRGSAAQIKLIRELLNKMGENFNDGSAVSKGGVRTIPFRGNALDALREIESIWPRIRKNKIEIIRSGGTKIKRTYPRKSSNDVPENPPINPPENPPIEPPEKTPTISDNGRCGEFEPSCDNGPPECSSENLVSEPTRQEKQDDPPSITVETLKAIQKSSARSKQENQDLENQRLKNQGEDKPQIIVVAGENELTIASSDLEALDQLEQLLRTIQRGNRGGIGSSNFAVYLLSNSSAKDTAKLLSELFDAIPETERQGSIGNAIFVSDERLNAMVVYGTRKERDVIQEIIEVLDAEDLPDSLTTPTPELIQVKNSSADRILNILQSVYATQLTSGGGRKKVEIPEGVSSDVASMLQQINAATAGPILTLGMDKSTNSIVMRAPVELGREIKTFVNRLDDTAKQSPSQKIRVLKMRGTNANRVQTILNRMNSEN